MQAIILAGGLGTRLRSTVGDQPKVLAPVLGKPWLAWLLEYLQSQGFKQVCIATGYKGDAVAAAMGTRVIGRSGSMQISYSHETEPLGTGGALAQAQEMLGLPTVFAMNGDTIITLEWEQMLARHNASHSPMTIAVRRVPDRSRYGAVEITAGHIVRYAEKSVGGDGLVSAGVYVLSADLFARFLPPAISFSVETAFIKPLMAELRPTPFVTDSPFLDIGIPEDYARAADFIRRYIIPVLEHNH